MQDLSAKVESNVLSLVELDLRAEDLDRCSVTTVTTQDFMQFSLDQTAFCDLLSPRGVQKCHIRLGSNAQCPKLRSLFSCSHPVIGKFDSADSVAISEAQSADEDMGPRPKDGSAIPRQMQDKHPNVSTSDPFIWMP